MADEARAMLDALMGADRNAVTTRGRPSAGAHGNRNKKSCYDHDICPLYCAWGVDVYDLFTNTKSDLGPNPYVIDEHAHEEFKGLPDHEKDRLGYEFMLYRKLQDLVRGCDRIVMRNRDKLKAEMARQARTRGDSPSTVVDHVANVPEDQVLKCAESIAQLELAEEELASLAHDLEKLDQEEAAIRNEIKKFSESTMNRHDGEEEPDCFSKDKNENSGVDVGDGNIESEEAALPLLEHLSNGVQDSGETTSEGASAVEDVVKTATLVDDSSLNGNENYAAGTEEVAQMTTASNDAATVADAEQKASLSAQLSSTTLQKQRILVAIQSKIEQSLIPLRETIEGQKRQLHYIRSDTTSDKTVCEISGNFMSSRDAEERIAAHYAGKQYVGWKMVRDKLKVLHKKYSNPGRGGGAGPPQPGPYLGGRLSGGGYHGGGYGAPPLRGGPPGPSYGGVGFGGGPPMASSHGHGPPPSYRPHTSGGGPPPRYGREWERDHIDSIGGAAEYERGRHDARRGSDRSRSRETNVSGKNKADRGGSDFYGSAPGHGERRGGGKRSESPGRWERDRAPSASIVGSRGYDRSDRHGGMGNDRDREGSRGTSNGSRGNDRDREGSRGASNGRR